MKLMKKIFLGAFVMVGALTQQASPAMSNELKARIERLMTPEELQQFGGGLAAVPDALLPFIDKLVGDIEEVKQLNMLRNLGVIAEENKRLRKINEFICKVTQSTNEKKEKKEKKGNIKKQSLKEKFADFLAFGPVLSSILFLIYKYNLASMVFATFTSQMGVVLNSVKCMLPLFASNSCQQLTAEPVLYVVSCGLIYLVGAAAVYKNATTYAHSVKSLLSLLQDVFMCCFQPVRDLINAMVASAVWTLAAAHATARGIKKTCDYGLWGLGGLWGGSKLVLGTGLYATKFVGTNLWRGANFGLQGTAWGLDKINAGTRWGLGKLQNGCANLRNARVQQLADQYRAFVAVV